MVVYILRHPLSVAQLYNTDFSILSVSNSTIHIVVLSLNSLGAQKDANEKPSNQFRPPSPVETNIPGR